LAAQVTWPGLTSVRQPLEQVAVEVVRILHTVLAHKSLTEKGLMLQPSLVVRGSSQRHA
jgi:DNA-binding LacI/PurR family transcriptional regulator